MTGGSREGTTVGEKYVLSNLLGVGGMGEVYEATNITIDRRVAIKFLRPEVATNPTIVERFRNEARAAGGVDNEHIAAALDFGIAADGAPFIVMELLKGENLASLLAREGQLPVPRATDIIIQACRGLSAAHEKGIVHRDLKPENIFICKRADGADLVKVLDFGIAKLRVGGCLTRPGTAMGTPLYMPPEQFANLASVGSPGDVYGLGVILYEALTGKKAHPDGSYYEIMHHVTNVDPQSIETLRPGFPPGLSDVVSRAMARKAGDRFQTVEALIKALKPFTGPGALPDRTKVLPTTDRHAPTRPDAPSQPDLAGAVAGGLFEGPKKVRSAPSFPTGKVLGIGATLLVSLAFGVWTLLASRSCGHSVPPVDAGVEDIAHLTDACAGDARTGALLHGKGLAVGASRRVGRNQCYKKWASRWTSRWTSTICSTLARDAASPGRPQSAATGPGEPTHSRTQVGAAIPLRVAPGP